MEINVISCNNCPFCIKDWDPNAVGNDMYVFCNLMQFITDDQEQVNDIIDCFNTYKRSNWDVKTPDWCPLTELKIIKE